MTFFPLAAILQYSVFGSISTVGAMLGAVMSGKIADLFGRRGVSLTVTLGVFILTGMTKKKAPMLVSKFPTIQLLFVCL